MFARCSLVVALFASACFTTVAGDVQVVDRPPAGENAHYVTSRAPLQPSRLIKLPIGAIETRGWVRKQLRLQAEGFHGHLNEISRFLKKEGNAWLSKQGRGEHGWEEVPYWLKGFGNCAYLLRDEAMIAETKVWIEGAIASQKPDGWFGPDQNVRGLASRVEGRSDLWPNMIMLFCLQDYYDFTSDQRVIELMTRYMRYLHDEVPADKLLNGYWPVMRGGDLLFSVYWLYNRTGHEWLLELGSKVHADTARWDEDVINWHNVNIAQGFGQPGTYFLQSGDPIHLEAAYRNHRKVRELYGQVPGGMFGADENARPGYNGPRQAIETCGIVEEMLSDETLLLISGDPFWADQCERVAFNSLPAALTADMKALRYLTAPNHVLSDAANKSPGLQNRGPMYLMSPHSHRCCQHNWGHGWPYYAQHLWVATSGNGLAAVMYAPCTVTATVGSGKGTKVKVTAETEYPFGELVSLKIATPATVKFPLYLRVPPWCDAAQLDINREPCKVHAKPGEYLIIDRTWSDGDEVSLAMPMEVDVRRWQMNQNFASVERGPLSYSLKIGEKFVRHDGSDQWPNWEIHPTTPWNYGLLLDEDDPANSFQLVQRKFPDNQMPFTHDGVPVMLRVKAKKIPNWKSDRLGLVGKMQPSPVKSDEPAETVTLIPMGAARLRVSALPVIGEGSSAHQWQEAPPPPPGPTIRRSLLRTPVAPAGIMPLLAGSLQAQSSDASRPLIAYVGTFSSPLRDMLPTQVDLPPGNGRGIHLFQIDRASGAMTPAGVHEMGTSPSCLVLNASGTRMYSANETDRVGEDKQGTISSFAVNPADGQLQLLNTAGSGGAGPTYVSIHPSGRFLLVANYFGGSVSVLPILPDGRLGKATDIKNDAGKIGPTRATNAPPGSFAFSGHDRTHAHMIQADPSGRFVLHADLGLDQIFVWKFDQQKGLLTPNEPPTVSLPAGDGPRHFYFHPGGRWFYSIQEEGSTIVLFDYDAAAGQLTARQTISSLPPEFGGSNFCSEIMVSADGRFVYAGNRLHDSIGIFSVGRNGDLTFIGEEWTRGNYPRSFNFDPTGQFLYCCNQRADNITVFQVNRKTGSLNFTGHYTPVGNPSIIVFRDLANVD